MVCPASEWQSQDSDSHVSGPSPPTPRPSPARARLPLGELLPAPRPGLQLCGLFSSLLSLQPNHWASESVLRLGKEGDCREPTVEKSFQRVDLQAL